MKFRGLSNVQDQNLSDQWLDRFCKDFNTGKNDQVTKRNSEKKNISTEKYDEIRRLDGIIILPILISRLSQPLFRLV
jgi:hypothetical protein